MKKPSLLLFIVNIILMEYWPKSSGAVHVCSTVPQGVHIALFVTGVWM